LCWGPTALRRAWRSTDGRSRAAIADNERRNRTGNWLLVTSNLCSLTNGGFNACTNAQPRSPLHRVGEHGAADGAQAVYALRVERIRRRRLADRGGA